MMECDSQKERENILMIQAKIKQAKQAITDLDTFKVGNYVDVMDDSKNWCVGEIIERVGDTVLVHFEGCSNKYDEKVKIKRVNKITHFRRFTKGYTGLKKGSSQRQ